MLKRNYLIVYRFFIGEKEIAGNLFYKMTRPKNQKDIELLEMQMRRDIAEKYPKVNLPPDIIIENIMEL
jgi:hypothetical protein